MDLFSLSIALGSSFWGQYWLFKVRNGVFLERFCNELNKLSWSDPKGLHRGFKISGALDVSNPSPPDFVGERWGIDRTLPPSPVPLPREGEEPFGIAPKRSSSMSNSDPLLHEGCVASFQRSSRSTVSSRPTYG